MRKGPQKVLRASSDGKFCFWCEIDVSLQSYKSACNVIATRFSFGEIERNVEGCRTFIDVNIVISLYFGSL